MLTPNLGGMDTTDILLTAMATMERGLLMPSLTLMLTLSLGGMETMDMVGLLTAMATTGRDLPMRSQQLMLTPNLGGMDTTDILLTAMATMGRGLLMPILTLMLTLSLGGMEAMDMAGPMVSIGDKLTTIETICRRYTPKHCMHQIEPKCIMARPKILITRKITILASSYCYLSSPW